MKYFNLTNPQKRIWSIDKVNLDTPIYNIGGCLKIKGDINIEKLKETINKLILVNEGLRIRIVEKDNQPLQYVSDYKRQEIDFVDFTVYENCIEMQKEWAQRIFRTKIPLEDSQLCYFATYKVSDDEYGIFLCIHHIISDCWSISILEKQVCEIYSKLVGNEEISLEDYYSYIDYINDENTYLISNRFTKNKIYWNEKFRTIPEVFLYNSTNDTKGNRQTYNLDQVISLQTKKYAEKNKCSLNTVFIAALIVYIYKTTYKKDIVIGTPSYGRINRREKQMVGMFTSTIPVKYSMDEEISYREFIKQVNSELKQCFLNQQYPYNLLIQDTKLSKRGYDSLFKISVNYYNSKYSNNIAGNPVELQEYYSGNQSYSLQIIVKEYVDLNIILDFDYKTAEYSESDIEVLYVAIRNIINQIIVNDEIKIKDINIINEEERYKKIYVCNDTQSDYPHKTISELFEESVKQFPDKIAVKFKENKLTFNELNKISNQVANYLRQKGVTKNTVVGVMLPHSIELIVSLLGVLKAGGAYLPIDINYPTERINYMLHDSQCSLVLTLGKIQKEINDSKLVVEIDHINLESYNNTNLTQVSGLHDLTYIIYTSGSTGKPKGVMIEQQGLVNYIWWAQKKYLKDENEVMPLYSSISFDLTVTSIFTPLIAGKQMLIYESDESEFVLYKILRENKSTVMKLTPAHLALLKDLDNTNSSIKRLIVGGEDLKVALAQKVYESFGRNVEIYNEYGPTETVVGCMIYLYNNQKDNGISVPIGEPIDNTQIYILDKEYNIVPTGVNGELFISGDGVAKGYMNREDLNHEKFVQNPFIKTKRMYRTGDIARYMNNYLIKYVGRNDKQIKIRGFRIELGEIEKYLLQDEDIEDAVVIISTYEDDKKLLIAYIVSKQKIHGSDLKKRLEKFLPTYMIPNHFIEVKSIPLTLNGKIDYERLPKPRILEKKFIGYRNDKEKLIVQAIEEVLDVKEISMNDNYYDLGGDSIKAIQISSKLKNIGLVVKIKDILNSQCISEIFSLVTTKQESGDISQDYCKGTIEGTPITNYFFQQHLYNENGYSQYLLLDLCSYIYNKDISVIITKLVQHHDALRINYDNQRKSIFYNENHIKNNYQVKELKIDIPSNSCKLTVNDFIENANMEFDLTSSLLFDVVLIEFTDKKQKLLLNVHHLVIDGVSWRIILEDFMNILDQIVHQRAFELPRKTQSFQEWALQLKEYSESDFSKEEIYWNHILEKKTTFPVDYLEEADLENTSSILEYEFDEDTTDRLIKQLSEIYSIQVNQSLIIALVVTIQMFTNSEDIIIELEGHGRENMNAYVDYSRTVGWFTSIYPTLIQLPDTDIEAIIKSVKEQLHQIPNNGISYGVLKYLKNRDLRLEEKGIRFNYLGDFDSVLQNNRINISSIEFGLFNDPNNKLMSLVDITALIIDRKMKISMKYSKKIFKQNTMQLFLDRYICNIDRLLNCCKNKITKEYTPSDFDAADLSQDEIDSIFE